MKKWFNIKELPYEIPAAGMLGAALRLWQLTAGRGEDGLLVAGHPAKVLLAVLTLAVAAVLWKVTRSLREEERSAALCFPASVPGALGADAGAAGMAATGWLQLTGSAVLLDRVGGVMGLVAGMGLLMSAYGRFRGKQLTALAHIPTSLFLALWLFTRAREWGAEPEIWMFLPELAAMLSLMLAAYQRTAFDAVLGRRDKYVFWNLMAVYLCVTAVPGSKNALLLVTGALWMITNVCVLDPLPPEQEEVSEEAPEEAPAEEAAAQEQQPEEE